MKRLLYSAALLASVVAASGCETVSAVPIDRDDGSTPSSTQDGSTSTPDGASDAASDATDGSDGGADASDAAITDAADEG